MRLLVVQVCRNNLAPEVDMRCWHQHLAQVLLPRYSELPPRAYVRKLACRKGNVNVCTQLGLKQGRKQTQTLPLSRGSRNYDTASQSSRQRLFLTSVERSLHIHGPGVLSASFTPWKKRCSSLSPKNFSYSLSTAELTASFPPLRS